MNRQHISDEQLNAFVDNELSAEEQNQLFLALNSDENLNRSVCETRKLRDLLRYAYQEPPTPPAHQPPPRRWRYTDAIAASFLLLVGALLGWFTHGTQSSLGNQAVYEHQDLDAFQTVQLLSAEGKQQNVILHLTTDDPHKLAYALDEVQTLLDSYRKRGLPIRLEVVANGDGLSLLRSKVSPYPTRTEQLIKEYDNLTIMACANALHQLKEQGVDTQLLPHVPTTKSALERVVERLQEGWLYVKV